MSSDEWPVNFIANLSLTPASNKSVANPWRRSWNRRPVTPANRQAVRQLRLKPAIPPKIFTASTGRSAASHRARSSAASRAVKPMTPGRAFCRDRAGGTRIIRRSQSIAPHVSSSSADRRRPVSRAARIKARRCSRGGPHAASNRASSSAVGTRAQFVLRQSRVFARVSQPFAKGIFVVSFHSRLLVRVERSHCK